MEKYQRPLITEWPTVSFDDFEGVEIQNGAGRFLYKGFFAALRVPEFVVKSFVTVFKQEL